MEDFDKCQDLEFKLKNAIALIKVLFSFLDQNSKNAELVSLIPADAATVALIAQSELNDALALLNELAVYND